MSIAKLRNISPTNMVTAVALPSKAHLTCLVRTVAASYWICRRIRVDLPSELARTTIAKLIWFKRGLDLAAMVSLNR
jgi:hypothetical protein